MVRFVRQSRSCPSFTTFEHNSFAWRLCSKVRDINLLLKRNWHQAIEKRQNNNALQSRDPGSVSMGLRPANISQSRRRPISHRRE